jgi:hypothetical protein
LLLALVAFDQGHKQASLHCPVCMRTYTGFQKRWWRFHASAKRYWRFNASARRVAGPPPNRRQRRNRDPSPTATVIIRLFGRRDAELLYIGRVTSSTPWATPIRWSWLDESGWITTNVVSSVTRTPWQSLVPKRGKNICLFFPLRYYIHF